MSGKCHTEKIIVLSIPRQILRARILKENQLNLSESFVREVEHRMDQFFYQT